MINSHWGKAATGKKKSCVYACRVTSVISIYTVEYYSAIKRNTFESVLMRWMNLELIIQSEVRQKEKNKYYILMHIYRI